MSAPTVGVLALQGAFARHVDALRSVGAEAVEVRSPEQLGAVDALVIPGGESTTISKLLVLNDLLEDLRQRLDERMPVFGTCAGMILLATEIIDGRPDQHALGAIDISVRRNGYGRQIDSFEADIALNPSDDFGVEPFRAVFIRAPKIERVGDRIEVLATVDEVPVLVRSGSVLVASFHPELTDDHRLHRWFVEQLVAPAPAAQQ